jgi:hypothetical protein
MAHEISGTAAARVSRQRSPTPSPPILAKETVIFRKNLLWDAPCRRRKEARRPAFAKTEFATDSALEGAGFELSVPHDRLRFKALSLVGRLVVRRTCADPFRNR